METFSSYGKLYIFVVTNFTMPPGRLKLTKEDRDWASKVKERDGNMCVVCNTLGVVSIDRLNAHHIIPRELKEFKYNVDNGISLCPKHHFFCREISAHNNPLGFFMWMEKYRPLQLELVKEMLKNANS